MTDLPTRFWTKVDKSGGPDACWLWTGCATPSGYGQFQMNGRPAYAHRLAYEAEHGPLGSGLQADHYCHQTLCVNAKHLRAATIGQNQQNRQGATVKNRLGIRGIFSTPLGRYRVQVQKSGRKYDGGTYKTLEEADQAARALRDRLFTHHTDGAKTA